MDNPEQAHHLLTTNSPLVFCDDCIASKTGISLRQQINVIARSLALTRDFERNSGAYSECVNKKLVTRSLRYAART